MSLMGLVNQTFLGKTSASLQYTRQENQRQRDYLILKEDRGDKDTSPK
jgi:hypothetical protein